jgi:hypothetical protein
MEYLPLAAFIVYAISVAIFVFMVLREDRRRRTPITFRLFMETFFVGVVWPIWFLYYKFTDR